MPTPIYNYLQSDWHGAIKVREFDVAAGRLVINSAHSRQGLAVHPFCFLFQIYLIVTVLISASPLHLYSHWPLIQPSLTVSAER